MVAYLLDSRCHNFDGPLSPNYLRIHDLVTLNTLRSASTGTSFDDTWTSNTDYVLTPLNAPLDGWPYTTIERHPNGLYPFPTNYHRMVEITGIFGWPQVPAPIKDATTILAARLVKRMREAPFGVTGVGIDGVAVRIANTDPDVRLLVQPYVRAEVLIH